VEVPKGDAGDALLKAIGGYFETFFSVNPHWTANFKELPKHPTANGVKPFTTNDEWYYNMRFQGEMKGVTPLLTAVPPDNTRRETKDAHGGNPDVFAAKGKNQPSMSCGLPASGQWRARVWLHGAHFHKNWSQDDFRKAILNSIVWIAGLEVPADGVASKRPDAEELVQNIPENKKKPANFDMAAQIKNVETLNAPK
jgi:hypothetical protein